MGDFHLDLALDCLISDRRHQGSGLRGLGILPFAFKTCKVVDLGLAAAEIRPSDSDMGVVSRFPNVDNMVRLFLQNISGV